MSSDSQSHPDIAIQRLQGDGRFSDQEAREIYTRAAEIESESLFKNDELTPDQLERGGNRAGISDAAIQAAIKERETERQKQAHLEREQALQKARVTKILLTAGAVTVGVVGLVLWSASSALGARQQSVLGAQSQIENVLERRHNLVPNLISLTKSTLQNQNALINSLQGAAQSAKNAAPENQSEAQARLKTTIDQTLQALRREEGASPEVIRLADEMAGAENRIAVERKRMNQAVQNYNRVAGSFPISWVRGVLGYPRNYPYFQSSQSARDTPRF